MTKSEILELCKKNFIAADRETAMRLKYNVRTKLAMPALVGVSNKALTHIQSEDNDGLHANFYGIDGLNCATVSSHYAAGDYVYVREPYFLSGNNVEYCVDNPRRCRFEKDKVISARYMKKSLARTFFKVRSVSLMRLHDIQCDEIHDFGFRDFDSFFRYYDSTLSEKQYEYSRSDFNPYIFVYEVERVFPEIPGYDSAKTMQWYIDNGKPVPGSGEDVALRQRENDRLRMEAEIMEAAKTQPIFGRLLEIAKEKERKAQ